jgi:predicted RNA-binding protein
MCDLKVFVKHDNKEELVLESVNQLRIDGNDVVLRNLFGEEKRVRGVIREVSLTKNRVIVGER